MHYALTPIKLIKTKLTFFLCLGLPVNGSCVGNPNNFGNHVGDWEHNTIRFVVTSIVFLFVINNLLRALLINYRVVNRPRCTFQFIALELSILGMRRLETFTSLTENLFVPP